MKKAYDRSKLFSRPQLKERGWTSTMIDKHLPMPPDDWRENPHYKCAAPMALWTIRRVKNAERRNAVKADLERYASRKKKARDEKIARMVRESQERHAARMAAQ